MLAAGDECRLDRAMLYAGSHLTLQEVRDVGAEEEAQVQGNLIWLIKVYKEFTVQVNFKQGLGGD